MKVKYTIKDFNEQFPNDDACLRYLFKQRNPEQHCGCGKSNCFHRISGRKQFACAWCGVHVAPTSGTIFHKSSTPLRTWFHAMFIMTASRNGVSAMELMRQVGVCYRTAWRMNHQIRQLMTSCEPFLLHGTIEADETYIGGKRPGKRGRGAAGKTPVAGLIERDGKVDATVVPDCKAVSLVPNIVAKVEPGSTIYTDELGSYNKLTAIGFNHDTVRHNAGEFVRGEVHTNGMESFWAQFKRSVHGTFHHISPQHSQKYLNEFAYRNNHRQEPEPMFCQLVATAGEQRDAAV